MRASHWYNLCLRAGACDSAHTEAVERIARQRGSNFTTGGDVPVTEFIN